ncbi:CAMK protein kinase [Saprolegnia diclina VS20]|uniref:CAMK protein kinase n=1 Tax=Saprolegnia diclina (strain VS20) TaxID=1156394 RepID=T0S4S4_SAPDV|nr:CAMK protein kinase [Saprolegnia diclina VS20]EQC37772.1 CAMK protein kinase [Saprolegnia diclina VS20]|eukprot:XP_008608705.1 CAMK protein kinase [Saprolegnia diclina VS20]
MWWYGFCAAWGCCASLSFKEQAVSVYDLTELISASRKNSKYSHQVYRATHRGTGEIVALKVMDRGTLAHPTQRRNIRREIHLMSKLHHPNLVHLFGVYESTNTVEIAFELSKGGEVMRRVLEPHASIFALTEAELSRAVADIVQGLVHLHEREWIHGDLRPEHMLFSELDPDSKALLVDFGRAGPSTVFSQCSKKLLRQLQEVRFFPPFILVQNALTLPTFQHAVQVDLWALGVSLYIMLFASFPFPGDSIQAVMDSVLHKPLQFPPGHAHISRAAKDLVARLLSLDPNDWMTADDVARHPWLANPAVAPNVRWSHDVISQHADWVLYYSQLRTGIETPESTAATSPRPNAEYEGRSSCISTDGVLVLETNSEMSADAYMQQADWEMSDILRMSCEQELSRSPFGTWEAEASPQHVKGWRLMWNRAMPSKGDVPTPDATLHQL